MFDKVLVQKCADILCKRQQTMAVAESVTAGFLQAAFASAENASFFFQGGLTAYNAKQKYTHLEVDLVHAVSCNAVSELVAGQMAKRVSRSFLTDWGIGVTGYASTLPGHTMNPLFAYYAISFKNEMAGVGEIKVEQAEPLMVQLSYVNYILQSFSDLLDTHQK